MLNYWLHRISHESEASYPLLENGYLSIGFSEGFSNEKFLNTLSNFSKESEAWTYFEKTNEKYWGYPRNRYFLWRFLYEFKEGDYILVPMYKSFSIFRIVGKPIVAGTLEKSINVQNNVIEGNGEKLLYNGNPIDIGFLIPVKLVEKNISRDKYADSELTRKMKSRQTNINITKSRNSIEDAIERFRLNRPISLYNEIIDNMSETMIIQIREKLDDTKFETLIKWYLEKIGADFVTIPPKNERNKSEYSDGDVVAQFDVLEIVLAVQAKFHIGETNSWGIKQIEQYGIDLKENMDKDYNQLNWVISSADSFTNEAISLASEKNIRLINGTEFAEMLIEAGLKNIDHAFEKTKY